MGGGRRGSFSLRLVPLGLAHLPPLISLLHFPCRTWPSLRRVSQQCVMEGHGGEEEGHGREEEGHGGEEKGEEDVDGTVFSVLPLYCLSLSFHSPSHPPLFPHPHPPAHPLIPLSPPHPTPQRLGLPRAQKSSAVIRKENTRPAVGLRDPDQASGEGLKGGSVLGWHHLRKEG